MAQTIPNYDPTKEFWQTRGSTLDPDPLPLHHFLLWENLTTPF